MEDHNIVERKTEKGSAPDKAGRTVREFEVTVTGTENRTWQGTVRKGGYESAFCSEIELIRIISEQLESGN